VLSNAILRTLKIGNPHNGAQRIVEDSGGVQEVYVKFRLLEGSSLQRQPDSCVRKEVSLPTRLVILVLYASQISPKIPSGLDNRCRPWRQEAIKATRCAFRLRRRLEQLRPFAAKKLKLRFEGRHSDFLLRRQKPVDFGFGHFFYALEKLRLSDLCRPI